MSSIENIVPDSALISTVSSTELDAVDSADLAVCEPVPERPVRPTSLAEWLSPDPASTSVIEAVLGESLQPAPPSTAAEALRQRGIELVPREQLRPAVLERRLERMVRALNKLGIEVSWCVHLKPAELYEKLYVSLTIDNLGVPSPGFRWRLDMVDITKSDEMRLYIEFYAPGLDDSSGDLGTV